MTVDKRSRCARRKDEGKKGSESRCDQTEVNNKDDDRKKRDRKDSNRMQSPKLLVKQTNKQTSYSKQTYYLTHAHKKHYKLLR